MRVDLTPFLAPEAASIDAFIYRRFFLVPFSFFLAVSQLPLGTSWIPLNTA
jgi:hypothetical protein